MRTVLCLLLVLASSLLAAAADRKIEDFYGAYLGHGGEVTPDGATQGAAEKTTRFSQVIIRPAPQEHGFTVEWSTLKLKGDELPSQADTKTYVETFRATDKPNIFRDITSGDPAWGADVAWAVINGNTLSMVQVTVSSDGNYFVVQYDRTLTAMGMDVHFTRFENGRIVRAVQLKLLKGPATVN